VVFRHPTLLITPRADAFEHPQWPLCVVKTSSKVWDALLALLLLLVHVVVAVVLVVMITRPSYTLYALTCVGLLALSQKTEDISIDRIKLFYKITKIHG